MIPDAKAHVWRADGEQAGSGGFVEEDLVASDLSRRRITDEGRGGAGASEMSVGKLPEETHNHRGIFDQGDQCEASATPWTGEHIQPLPE